MVDVTQPPLLVFVLSRLRRTVTTTTKRARFIYLSRNVLELQPEENNNNMKKRFRRSF